MRSVALAGWLALAGPAIAAPCDAPTSARDLHGAASTLEQAIEAMDLEAVSAAAARVDAAVLCASHPLSPSDAAAALRAHGLGLYFAGEADEARAWFARARALEPSYVLPAALAPGDEHPLRLAYAAALPDGGTTPLPAPAEGVVRIDGTVADAAPAGPYLFQRLDGAGAVVDTQLVAPGYAVPAYDVAASPPAPLPTDPPRRVPWLTASGAAVAIGAGAASTATWLQARSICTLDTDLDGRPDACPDAAEKRRYDGLRAAHVATFVGAVAGGGLVVGGIFVEVRPGIRVSAAPDGVLFSVAR